MKLYIITGQTATGKTSLALELAQKYNGELINCDSRQVYKYLNIVTGKDVKGNFFLDNTLNNFEVGYYKIAKPPLNPLLVKEGKKGEVKDLKLWLSDILNPNKYFSSYDYVKLTIPLLKKIISEGKTPIIVGGTYLYLKHLLYGVETENIPPDWELRQELRNKSVIELQEILKALDLQSIKQLNNSDKNNPQRLIRKIEILSSGAKEKHIQPRVLNIALQKSEIKQKEVQEYKLNIKDLKIEFIGLKFKEIDNLRKAIEKRVEERINMGALEEVRRILAMGYKPTDPGLRTIGYQQLILHLTAMPAGRQGVVSLPEALKIWVNKEVQYAKRQYTFMKKDKNITWRLV